MKFLWIFLAAVLLFSSCKNERRKSIVDKVNPSDKECISEIREARADVRRGKLIYCHYGGNIIYQYLRAEKEMDSLLNLYNIGYKEESSPCVVHENKRYHCYCELMQEEIDSKFGAHLTDKLLHIADSLFISKNLDKTYDYTGWDTPPLFPGDTEPDSRNHSGLQATFSSSIQIQGEKYGRIAEDSIEILAFITSKVLIDRKGIANVTDQQLVYWGAKDKEQDFISEVYSKAKPALVSLIEKTTWIPAKIKNIPVLSDNEVVVYFYY